MSDELNTLIDDLKAKLDSGECVLESIERRPYLGIVKDKQKETGRSVIVITYADPKKQKAFGKWRAKQ